MVMCRSNPALPPLDMMISCNDYSTKISERKDADFNTFLSLNKRFLLSHLLKKEDAQTEGKVCLSSTDSADKQ